MGEKFKISIFLSMSLRNKLEILFKSQKKKFRKINIKKVDSSNTSSIATSETWEWSNIYNELLDRIYWKLKDKDPKLIKDKDKCQVLPSLKVEHTRKKTIVTNFFDICKKIAWREPSKPSSKRLEALRDKLKLFIINELGEEG